MPKAIIGDIFEINTPKGKAYLHYIYKDSNPKMGMHLIRVLKGLYFEKPNLEELARSHERYMIFFPVSAAYNRKIIDKVGHFSAENFSKPKHMRDEHNVRGEHLGWHIIDTDTWHRQLVKELTPDQKKLSEWGTWNDTLLIERLISDWSLEKWG